MEPEDELPPAFVSLLTKLGAGLDRADAFGCEISELSEEELDVSHVLGLGGLVHAVEGWHGSSWLMLTDKAFDRFEQGLDE